MYSSKKNLGKIGLILTVPYLLGAAAANAEQHQDDIPLAYLDPGQRIIEPYLSSQDRPDFPGGLDVIRGHERIANVFNLSELDHNRDGVLEVVGELKAGDILYREQDDFSQVEENFYHVPSNVVWDGEAFVRIKAIVVDSDNLTYLFAEDSNDVIAVFPNGTGSSGANTVASLRRVHYIAWGTAAGQVLQARMGLPNDYNYFGSVYLDTRYVVAPGMENDINTPQEIHGTDPRLNYLLGTEISGGCTRHRNQDAEYIARHLQVGDLVMTRLTPFDDHLNNPLNMLNQTRIAAEVPTRDEFPVGSVEFMEAPANFEPIVADLGALDRPIWQDLQQVQRLTDLGHLPPTALPAIRHPYTYANYEVIPCGSENTYMISYLVGRAPLLEVEGGFQLPVSDTLRVPDRINLKDIAGNRVQQIRVADFYTAPVMNYDTLAGKLHNFSGGDLEIAMYQALLSDFTDQFARHYLTLKYKREFTGSLDNVLYSDLREIQQITGLIPANYTYRNRNSEFPILNNRTVIHGLMNVFHGDFGEVYEIDDRADAGREAFPLRDIYFGAPSLDHEMERVGAGPESMRYLLAEAIDNNRGVIFRITGYRFRAGASMYFTPKGQRTINLRLAAFHYYSLIPQYSDLEAGYIGVFDSMHPHKILFMPLDAASQVFSTMTITPDNSPFDLDSLYVEG